MYTARYGLRDDLLTRRFGIIRKYSEKERWKNDREKKKKEKKNVLNVKQDRVAYYPSSITRRVSLLTAALLRRKRNRHAGRAKELDYVLAGNEKIIVEKGNVVVYIVAANGIAIPFVHIFFLYIRSIG